jgi:hypothetical protein
MLSLSALKKKLVRVCYDLQLTAAALSIDKSFLLLFFQKKVLPTILHFILAAGGSPG